MELQSAFVLPAPVDECWDLLIDLERVASCVPGFKASGWEDDAFTGAIKIKVGAVTVTYDSRIKLVESDRDERRAIMSAEGRERRGQGTVSATMRSELRPVDGGTEVTMTADVDVTGRVASFGRGILVDVNNRLVKRFARNVETTFLNPPAEPESGDEAVPGTPDRSAAAAAGASGTGDMVAKRGDEPLDLMSVAATPALRRIAPIAGIVAVLVILLRRWSR